MSFVFQLDPNEAEEGVKPTPAPGGRRGTTPGESSGQRRSLIAKSLEPVKSVNHSGSDDEADDEDDKGPSRKERRHTEQSKKPVGRRLSIQPIVEESTTPTADHVDQPVRVTVAQRPPVIREEEEDVIFEGIKPRLPNAEPPRLVRMYTGKMKGETKKRSSARIFLDDLKKFVRGGSGIRANSRAAEGVMTPTRRTSINFWSTMQIAEEVAEQEQKGKLRSGAGGVAQATPRSDKSTDQAGKKLSRPSVQEHSGKSQRRSMGAELLDDIEATLNPVKAKVEEVNVTKRPSKVGHLDDEELRETLRLTDDLAEKGRLSRDSAADRERTRPVRASRDGQGRRSSLSTRDAAATDAEAQLRSTGGLARRRSLSARRRSSLTNTSRRNPSLRGSQLAQPDSSNNLISPELVQAEAEAAAGAKAQDPSPPEEGPEPDLVFRLEEWIDDRNPGLGRQVVEEEWTANHAKLLYLISKFAVSARTAQDQESWIRSLPLIILMYEGIVSGCFDLDYAPTSTLISMDGKSRRVWLNTTQEGKAAIDDLREGKLINGLKLSTVDFQPITAYQVSLRGLSALEQVPDRLKALVDAYVHTPQELPFTSVRYKTLEELEEYRSMMAQHQSHLDEEEIEQDEDTEGFFVLMGERTKYIRRSSITSSEDVSYVSSPYLPTCIRNVRRMKRLTSNKHRAHESATGLSNIKDTLNEAIVLSNVRAIVGEWIPFGANQIVALNERLGSFDRCQGGLFSSLIDKYPCDLCFESEPGLTQVRILDFDPVRFVNFEAEIHFPEADGIVQVENFGLHVNVDGSVLYGVNVEAIMDRRDDDISLDMLSRMLVDVHQDSSSIMNDLLSKYQQALMDMIFMGDTDHRAKFNMIVADGIEPFLYCEEYMDREANENELKQVIGDLYNVYDVGEHAVLMLGRDGLIFAGSSAASFEQVLVSYVSMLVREMFLRVFFIRTFVLDELLKQTRQLVVTYESNPNNIAEIRSKLNEASRDIISLEALLEYLKESLENLKVPAPPRDKDGAALFKSLAIESRQKDVMNRVIDLRKLVHGARSEMQILQKMRDVINSKKLEDVYKDVEGNTKYLVDASAANERASASLEVMQVVLGGTLGFSIIDRLAGGTMNMEQPDWIVNYVVRYVIDLPYLWFVLNMLWFLLVSVCLFKFMRYLGKRSEGALTIRRKVNRRICVKSFKAYLNTKKLEVVDALEDAKTKTKKATWVETDRELWQGEPPRVDVQYDERYGFMLVVVLRVNARNTSLQEHQLMSRFLGIMQQQGIMLAEDDGGRGAEASS